MIYSLRIPQPSFPPELADWCLPFNENLPKEIDPYFVDLLVKQYDEIPEFLRSVPDLLSKPNDAFMAYTTSLKLISITPVGVYNYCQDLIKFVRGPSKKNNFLENVKTARRYLRKEGFAGRVEGDVLKVFEEVRENVASELKEIAQNPIPSFLPKKHMCDTQEREIDAMNEYLMNSVTDASDIFGKVYSVLDEGELSSLYKRLTLEDEETFISEKIQEYLTFFDDIVPTQSNGDKAVDSCLEDEIVDNCLKDEAVDVDENNNKTIEKTYFSCERDISTKIDIQDNDYKADGVLELFDQPKQIPLFLLEVSEEPNNLDPDKINEDRHKLLKEGVFGFNKLMLSTKLPKWKVCETQKIFLAQAFADKIVIGQLIFIGPGLYLFAPFTIPAFTIPTSNIDLNHVPRLIRTLLCLRYNLVENIERFLEFKKEGQEKITKSQPKYATGLTPERQRTVTFAEFLPKILKREEKKVRGRGKGRGRGI
ncbi:hypothetical protein C2G38_2040932 [Gigaspora rosea]|uniref:Uncharacterized protein n=1 Tax=Gigaspora rosea TaxID=44941 RepID=A0A397V0R2_9GLOM|nr:hypothetical protein C2G38_2040932 [Gigaspora rosea]